MRLAVFHNQPAGGARRVQYEIGRRLAQRHQLDVFALSSADESWLSSRDFAHQITIAPYALRSHVRLGLYLNDYRSWLSLRDLDAVSRQVAQHINDGAYDVVMVDVDRYLGAPFVLRYLALPNVYYCHEPPRRFLEPICRPSALPLSRWERARLVWRWPANRLMDRVMQRAELANARCAGLVLTNSHYNRTRIRHYYGLDAVVCYLGVDSGFFCPDHTVERRRQVLSVGSLEPHKGFDFLIHALARCRTRPRLCLVASTGHPRMRQHLLALATRLGVDVEIETAITDKALREHYRQAALMAFAPHFEPFGLVALEAMACETPVVGVAEGGVRESITDGITGLLVSRDETEVADAIDMLLTDEPRRQSMGRAGRADVMARWTWEAAAVRVEGHLAQMSAGR